MRHLFQKFTTIVLAMLFANPALAQNCDAILSDGVFNTSVRNTTYDSRDQVMRFACNSNTVSSGGGASAVIKGVPMSGNAYRQKVKNSCETYSKNRTITETDFAFVRDASAVIADAWSNCMSGPGMRVILQQSPDIKKFLITLGYRKAGSGSPTVSKATLNLVGGNARCTCTGSDCNVSENVITATVPDSGVQTLTCVRQNAEGILFALQSNVDAQKTASLPSIRLAPAVVISPINRYSSGGKCSYSDTPIPLFDVGVVLHDFDTLPTIQLSYRGNSSNLGNVSIDPMQTFLKENVLMMADRKSNNSGLFLTVGDQTKFILKQSGNYDCAYDRGKRKIAKLVVKTSFQNLFPRKAEK